MGVAISFDRGVRAKRKKREGIRISKSRAGPNDTFTARIAYVYIDQNGVSWMPLVLQRPGELIRQKDGSTYTEKRFWKVPGGKFEAGVDADIFHTASREFLEETGIFVSPDKLSLDFSVEFEMPSRRLDFDKPAGEDVAHRNIFFLYVTKSKTDSRLQPTDGSEIEKAMLFKLQGLLSLLYLYEGAVMAPSHRDKLAFLFSSKKCRTLLSAAGVTDKEVDTVRSLSRNPEFKRPSN